MVEFTVYRISVTVFGVLTPSVRFGRAILTISIFLKACLALEQKFTASIILESV